MTSEFLNKKILITGASSGIGKSVATHFLNSRAKVVLVGKDTESLKTLSKNFPKNLTSRLSASTAVFGTEADSRSLRY